MFRLQKKGHYSNECPERKNNINELKGIGKSELIDNKKIFIANKQFHAVFDTGAAVSIITSKYLKEVDYIKKILVKKSFKLINGDEINCKEAVDLDFMYEDKWYSDRFFVVNNNKEKQILISNATVKSINNNKEMLPIVCHINTGSSSPISWNRLIRSLRDKIEFQELITELESKNIVEESTSMWLNSVVLIKKRNEKLRFCVDFRKLNDLVVLDNYELPRIQEILMQLRNKKYFTTIDLLFRFFQILINPEDKEKTAFYTG